MTNTVAAALDALAQQYPDTTSEYNVLSALAYAFGNGCVDDVEAALWPLVGQWLELSDEQRESAVSSLAGSITRLASDGAEYEGKS